MNISLPDPMKMWVEGQSRTGRYSNASDYVRDLIRRDQERASKVEAMQQLVDEADADGVSTSTMADIFGKGAPTGWHGMKYRLSRKAEGDIIAIRLNAITLASNGFSSFLPTTRGRRASVLKSILRCEFTAIRRIWLFIARMGTAF